MQSKLRPRDRRSLMGGTYENETVRGDLRLSLGYGSRFIRCVFEEVTMGCSELNGCYFEDCAFIECDLAKTNFNSSTFVKCIFEECNLDLCSFKAAIFGDSKIIGGRMEYSTFENSTVTRCRFNTQMHGADLRFAYTEDLDYGESNLWGCSLNINCATFRNAKISERSLALLLGLVCQTQGNDILREKVLKCLPETDVAVIKRLACTV